MAEANGQTQVKFEHWCLVELFGHSQIAGFATEATIAGGAFIRVDVPNPEGEGALYTRYFGSAAIYAINPTTKEEVIELVARLNPKPPTPRVRQRRALTGHYDERIDYDPEDDCEEEKEPGPDDLGALRDDDVGF